MSECEICRGIGRVRLPIYRPAVAYAVETTPTAPMDDSRDYPRPECSGTVSEERLAIVQTSFDAEEVNDATYLESLTRRAANALALELLKRGLIKVERNKVDEGRQTFAVKATLGVVSPSIVASLQERVAQHQDFVASEVVRTSIARINNWGSYYGDTHVRKTNVADEMREALKEVLGRPKEWRDMVKASGR